MRDRLLPTIMAIGSIDFTAEYVAIQIGQNVPNDANKIGNAFPTPAINNNIGRTAIDGIVRTPSIVGKKYVSSFFLTAKSQPITPPVIATINDAVILLTIVRIE